MHALHAQWGITMGYGCGFILISRFDAATQLTNKISYPLFRFCAYRIKIHAHIVLVTDLQSWWLEYEGGSIYIYGNEWAPTVIQGRNLL
jgi:hypothetical protein